MSFCPSFMRVTVPILMLEFASVHGHESKFDTPCLTLRFLAKLNSEMGNQQSVKHDPISPYHNATSTKAPVIKSAMKRSTSIRNNAQGVGREKRYIPKMNQAANGGLVMPSRPYNHGKDTPPTGGDSFSPQWGWYTSLTPPDVMYSKTNHHNNHHKRSQSEPASVSIPEQAALNPPIIRDENQANHVFKSLQNSQAPVGWTSVPI